MAKGIARHYGAKPPIGFGFFLGMCSTNLFLTKDLHVNIESMR